MESRKIWTTEDEIVLRQLYPHAPDKEVAQCMQRSLWSIQSHAKRLRLTKSQEYHKKFAQERVQQLRAANLRYAANHSYFSSIDTREKAYWLGWLWSDGNIRQRGKSYEIKIEIHKNDVYILEHFANAVESNGRIIIKNNSAIFSVYSEEMFLDLNKYGIIPRKSYANIAPEIPLTFAADFVRGVFDGDGYISKNKQPQIVIVATQMLCHWLQEVIKDAVGTAGTCALKKNTTFRWILSGRMNLSLFAKWVYQQNLDGAYPLCLERKRQRFIDAGLLGAT